MPALDTFKSPNGWTIQIPLDVIHDHEWVHARMFSNYLSHWNDYERIVVAMRESAPTRLECYGKLAARREKLDEDFFNYMLRSVREMKEEHDDWDATDVGEIFQISPNGGQWVVVPISRGDPSSYVWYRGKGQYMWHDSGSWANQSIGGKLFPSKAPAASGAGVRLK